MKSFISILNEEIQKKKSTFDIGHLDGVEIDDNYDLSVYTLGSNEPFVICLKEDFDLELFEEKKETFELLLQAFWNKIESFYSDKAETLKELLFILENFFTNA